MNNPTPGTVLSIASGEYSAHISTLGGGLQACTFEGRPLVETYPDDELPPLACGLLLSPWPNRTADGAFEAKGQRYQLPINEPDRKTALHGFVHERQWNVEEHSSDVVHLSIDVPASESWPWAHRCEARYSLDSNGLRLTFIASTECDWMPYAMGWHAYLNPQGAELDDATLTLNASAQLPLDTKRKLPCGEPRLTQLVHGLAEGLPMRGVQLDDCFATAGPIEATVVGADGRGVRMTCNDNLHWAQVFTPDPLLGCGFPGRGRAVAVEPMTAPPNALVHGTDLITLSRGHPTVQHVRLTALVQSKAARPEA